MRKKRIVLKKRPYGQVAIVSKRQLVDVLETFFICVENSDFTSRRFKGLVAKSMGLYGQVVG
jgi:hypothetical protein